MQIASSNLIMASTENRSQKWEQQESLEIIIRDSSPMKPTDTVSISQAAMSCKCEKDQKIQESAVAINADRQHDLKALLVEILSGKKICFLSPADIMKTDVDEDVPVEEPDEPEDGIGIIYRKESEYGKNGWANIIESYYFSRVSQLRIVIVNLSIPKTF